MKNRQRLVENTQNSQNLSKSQQIAAENGPFSFPRLGVSLKFLREVFKNEITSENATIGQVYKHVLDVTKQQKCSMVEYWNEQPGANQNVVGEAEYYVIHAWSSRFKEDLLNTLENYRRVIEEEDLFLWIDVFSLNMHTLQRHLRIYHWWGVDFITKMKGFKEVIVSWPTWTSFEVLKSTWCVWEIYCALRAETPLGIALTEQDDLNLTDELVENFEKLVYGIKKFRVEETKSYDRRMQKRTMVAVKKHQITYSSFNEVALEAVKIWWAIQAYDKLPDLVERFTLENHGQTINRFITFVNALSQLLRLAGDIERCREVSLLAVKFGETKRDYLVSFPRERARDLNNLGVLLSESEDFHGAIENGEKAITCLKDFIVKSQQRLSAQVGATPNITVFPLEKGFIATGLNNLANLYFQLHQFQLAADRYEESVQIKIEIHGPDHPLVAAGLNNLGLAYTELKDFNGAEKVYRQALQTRVRLLGLDSVEVGQTRHNLAAILLENNLLQPAKKEAKLALDICLKHLGEQHEATIENQHLIEIINRKLAETK